MKINLTIEEFKEVQNNFTHVPISAEIRGDLETPVSVYLKLRDSCNYNFLLESAMQSGSSGRYSFIGLDPEVVVKYNNGVLSIKSTGDWEILEEDPIDYLRTLINKHRLPDIEDSLPPFCGGLVGFFSYDSVTYFEDGVNIEQENKDVPDFTLMLTYDLIAFDHFKHTLKIINIAPSTDDSAISYSRAVKRISGFLNLINKELRTSNDNFPAERITKRPETNCSKTEFFNMVDSAREHISDGDVFQLVLSRRFEIQLRNDEFEIYRALRRINPSPYMFYIHFDDIIITGSSPEVLVKCTGDDILTRPLAGTRKRGKNRNEDEVIINELLEDEKEKAEHVMLVDLGRNDLGRLSNYGSVSVSELMGIEKYSQVIHIVSEVTGKLRAGYDYFDVLKHCFPAGTVTGAPKIRAMELIDKYEKDKRGIYAGTVGYFDFKNNMDTCISIRTIVIKNKTAFIQAGAGIVADSVAENEYRETINKAGALIKAISEAEGIEYDISDR